MSALTNIKNIVFDLGNVLIPLDFERLRSSFDRLIADGDQFSFQEIAAEKSFLDYETGQISTELFLQFLKERLQLRASNQEVISAWNSLLGPFPQEHVTLLKKLGQQYRLFLLSNTNALHVKHFEEIEPGPLNVNDLFEKVYYSNVLHLRKPQPEIFSKVLNDNRLNAAQTLYLDDMEINCQAASGLGYQTLHVTPGLNLTNWFNQNSPG